MEKKFKPSMFNRIVEEENNNLVLFNSYVGPKNIIKISNKYKDYVIELLSKKLITLENNENDDIIKLLYEFGYLIDFEVDERLRRDLLYTSKRHDNTLRLVIHTSEACNFRCKYCYINFNEQSNRNMSIDVQNSIVEFVRKNINNYSSVQIDWFGGEPLIGMDVIENISKKVIEICYRARKPYHATITTNGYMLNNENIKKLIDYKVKHIAVTIDGLKHQHDNQRILINGGPTFDKIISNLINIRDNYKNQTLTVSIRNNLLVEAYDSIEEYYNYYNDLFGNDSRFSLFIRPVKDMGNENMDNLHGTLVDDNGFDFGKFYSKLATVIKDLQFNPNFVDLASGGLNCYARHLNRYTFSVNGLISKCDEAREDLSIGYIDNKGKLIIDQDKHNQWLEYKKRSDECDNCFYSCCCFMGSCPKARILHNYVSCPAKFSEIDGLILLYAKSRNITEVR